MGSNQEKLFSSLYDQARNDASNSGESIESHFNNNHLSEYVQANNAYIRLIVFKNAPIYYVVDEETRNFSKYDVKIGRAKLVEIILKLVELVEKRIEKEFSSTKGAILFDGWSSNDVHFVAVIASYCPSRSLGTTDVNTQNDECKLAPLALSPMGQITAKQGKEVVTNDEIARFNAEAHVQFFQEVFQFFGQTFHEWCVCLIADNCDLNLRISNLTGKFFVGCYSHHLNLELNYMVEHQSHMNQTIATIQKTMTDAKQLKNAALLRNLTPLKPVLHNKTRWSGKLHILERFLAIRDELFEISSSEDCNMSIDNSHRLLSRVEKFKKMLQEINIVTKALQTRGYKLSDCREDLNIRIQSVVEDRTNPISPLFQCKLGTKYIGCECNIVHHNLFESGVVKIQNNLEHTLTNAEKDAVSCLHMFSPSNESSSSNGENSSDTRPVRVGVEERMKKKRKLNNRNERYMNCNFILGSVAEVERVWSLARYVLTDNRRSLTPQLFEAIMFLKYNWRFWDINLVNESINTLVSDRIKYRMQQHQLQEEYIVE